MKSIKLFISAALVATALAANAAPLTPEEAYQTAMSERTSNFRRLPRKAGGMDFVYQVNGTQGPTVYIFANQGENAEGFMVLSADDVARPILGYSDTGTFDPNNIPPQMQWWLECCNTTIDALVANPTKAGVMNLGNHKDVDIAGPLKVRRARTKAIAPLCKTTWDQTTPYNNQCPTLSGQRAVTGCIATAMAQVMKVHQWPQKGSGTHSYSYKYNNRNYTESLDFSNTTFNWSSMLNSYNGNYNTTQANAVATLMHACGVAADMSYSPNGSGASDFDAAAGMIDYLGYDAGQTIQWRTWYLYEDWNNLIYNEIANGRPVMYTGNDGEGGHAFVCDGYDSNDYFHINWGWGGLADGYYLLTDLAPTAQGTGGSSGSVGYIYTNGALIGAQKAKAGSKRPMILACTDLKIDKSTYTTSETMTISSSGQFSNMSTCTLTNFYIGAVLVNEAGQELVYMVYQVPSLEMMYGFNGLPLKTQYFPNGKWKIYPAVASDPEGTDWVPFKYDPSLCGGYIEVEVTSTSVNASVAPGQEDDRGAATVGDGVNIDLVETDAENGCVPGQTYNFKFNFSASEAFADTYYCILIDANKMELVAKGDSKYVRSTTGDAVTQNFSITIPANATSSTNYAVCLGTLSGDYLSIDWGMEIDILEEDDLEIKLVKSTPDEYPFHTDTKYTLTFSFTSSKSFSEDYVLALYDTSSYQIMAESEAEFVNHPKAGSVNADFKLSIPADLDLNSNYGLAMCTIADDDSLIAETAWNVQIVKKQVGVDAIVIDPSSAEIFDLRGNRVTAPHKGIFIERTPNGTRKIAK